MFLRCAAAWGAFALAPRLLAAPAVRRTEEMPIASYSDLSDGELFVAFRRVVSGYSGPCLRLRRDSDDAESDFGFTDGLLNTAAITTWLSGAEGYGVAWYDQSANGHTAEQTDAAAQPLYSADGFIFDGVDDHFVCDSVAAAITGTSTPWAVSAVLTPATAPDFHCVFGVGAAAGTGFHYLGLARATDLYAYFGRDNDSGLASLPTTITTLAEATPVALGATYDGAMVTFVNGTLQSPRTSKTGAMTVDRAAIGLLHSNGTDYYPFDGTLTELAVFASARTSPELRDIALYQNEAYALFDAPRFVADNAASPQTTPTYDGAGQAVHPAIVDLGAGSTWNSYRYWLCYTPYPNGNADYENPQIMASNDGATWETPPGLTNPIVESPPGVVYGDSDLILGQDDVMYCVWLDTNDAVMEQHSSDGATWSSPASLFAVTGEGSPTVLWNGSEYELYTFRVSPTPNDMRKRTCATVTGTWSSPTEHSLPVIAGREMWDFEIIFDAGTYHGFFTYTQAGTSGTNTVCYYGTSADGETWDMDGVALLNPSTESGWNDKRIYRSSGVKTADGFDLWYSATASPEVWRIGFTEVVPYSAPVPPTALARAYAVWIA